jgi:hypothetical protein
VLLAAAGIALGVIWLFGEQLRIGKLIGVVVAGGGFGLLFLVWGLWQVLAEAWKGGRIRQVLAIVGVIVALGMGSLAAVYGLRGSTPPGDEFVPLIGLKRSDQAVAGMISRLGSFRENAAFMAKKAELDWKRHRVTMNFHDDTLTNVRLGGRSREEPYPGPLPFGLSPADSREAILAKLAPHSQGNYKDSNTFMYPQRGAEIFFDFENILAVELFPPNKAEAAVEGGSP